MTPERARKAARLEVFTCSDGSFSVPGDTDVYDVTPDRKTGEMRCNCPAASFGNDCTHRDAVIEYIKEHAA